MASCLQCTAEVDSAARFCTSCGAPMQATGSPAGDTQSEQNQRGWRPRQTATGPTTRIPPQYPGSPSQPPPFGAAGASSVLINLSASDIHLAHGEVVMRDFPVVHMRRPLGWMEGHIVVTDARVIYRARAKNLLGESHAAHEVQLSKITGAGFATQRGISPASVLTAGAIWSLFSFVLITVGLLFELTIGVFTDDASVAATLFMLWILVTGFLVAVLWMRSRRTYVMFGVSSTDTTHSPVQLTGYVGSTFSASGAMAGTRLGGFLNTIGAPIVIIAELLGIQSALEAAYCADTEATLAMYEEVGALILDLQNRGVLGGSEP